MNGALDKRALRVFWQRPFRREELKKILIWLAKRHDCTARVFCDEMSILELAEELVYDHRQIHRLLGGKVEITAQADAPKLSGLLLAIQSIFHGIQSSGDSESEHYRLWIRDQCAPVLELLVETYPHLATQKTDFQNTSLPLAPEAAAQQHVLRLVEEFLHIDPRELANAGKYFLPDDGEPSKISDKPRLAYFNCYRFHSSPSHIVKSFMVVKSPTTLVPVSLFSNFFVSKRLGAPRRTDGVIIPTPRTMYMIGSMRTGSGMKLVAVERYQQEAQRRFHGLMITFDDDEALVASRFVMVPSDANDHTQAKSGIYPLNSLKREIKDFLEELRNRVPFRLEKELKLDGRKLSQTQMVDATARALEKKGKGRLTDTQKHPFNPASDMEYTYNAALRSKRFDGRVDP